MTVERTREIFGDKMSHMTDREVIDFIGQMGVICDDILSTSLSQLTDEKLKRDTTKDK